MALDKKNKKSPMPIDGVMGDGHETPFEMQARGVGKSPTGKPGKPGKGGKGGFMQALKNAKKKGQKKGKC